jgi:26S proteasome regulatory subunit N8
VEIRDYLALVGKGKLPVNHQIMYNLQDIFNLLPDLDGNAREAEIKRTAFRVETNDQSLVVYLSSLIRSVLALHDLSKCPGDGEDKSRRSCADSLLVL